MGRRRQPDAQVLLNLEDGSVRLRGWAVGTTMLPQCLGSDHEELLAHFFELAPPGWKEMREHQHFVQVYDEDAGLVESVAAFLRNGLQCGAACIVIATRDHRLHIGARLRARGFDMDRAVKAGQYVSMDAATVLASLMVDGRPNLNRFDEIIGPVIAAAALRHQHVLAFGEMVGLLSQGGKHGMAVELEHFWNQLAIRHTFSLFCAYPRAAFSANDRDAFEKICAQHSAVVAA